MTQYAPQQTRARGSKPALEADADQFPELRRIGAGKKTRQKRIPHVQQMEWTDCGAACLAQVLGFLGREVTLQEVRACLEIGRDGVSAKDILNAGGRFGLTGRGVKVELNELELLPRGAILHWEFNHFVVFDRVVNKKVLIVDPAYGHREVTLDQVNKAFTGVALILEPNAGFSPKKLNRKQRLWNMVKEMANEKAEFSRILVISLVLRVFGLASPLLTSVVVDKIVPRGDLSLMGVVLIGLVAMTLFNAASNLVRAHILLQLRTKMDTRVTLGFLDHLVSLPYSFFQQRSTGDLMMRIRSNSTVREIVTANTMSAMLDGLFCVLYIAAVIFVSPLLALLILFFSFTNVATYIFTRKRNYQFMVEDLEIQSKTHGELVQMLEGIQTLKCGGVENRAVQNWSAHYVDEINISLKRGTLGAWIDAAQALITAAAPLTLLAVGATLVVKGNMSLGTMMAVSSLAGGVFGPISSLVDSALQLQLLGGYLDRIEDVMETAPEQNMKEVATPPKLTGRVSAQKVVFRYNVSNTDPVVNNVNLEVRPGTSVAIVGMSGSGKSTLANLLVGLFQPQEGTILFDGQELSKLDMRAVRRQIGIVPQSPFIFAGSIRENISLTAPGASMEEVTRAAQIACIHDDITAMPMGYETLVSSGGSTLSGGQRQRIAVARAVIRHAPIIMLDEATSSLDAMTEERVMQNLRHLGCTRIIIAHRLSTIADADLIVVMHQGKVIEMGTHQQLLQHGGGYWQLIKLQSGTVAHQGRELRP